MLVTVNQIKELEMDSSAAQNCTSGYLLNQICISLCMFGYTVFGEFSTSRRISKFCRLLVYFKIIYLTHKHKLVKIMWCVWRSKHYHHKRRTNPSPTSPISTDLSRFPILFPSPHVSLPLVFLCYVSLSQYLTSFLLKSTSN